MCYVCKTSVVANPLASSMPGVNPCNFAILRYLPTSSVRIGSAGFKVGWISRPSAGPQYLDSPRPPVLDAAVASPIDDFCEQLRSNLHAKKLERQADLEIVRRLLADLEMARQTELVAAFCSQKGLPVVAHRGPSATQLANKLLAAVEALSELRKEKGAAPPVAGSGEGIAAAVAPSRPPSLARQDQRPEPSTPWPKLLACRQVGPIVVVGGSPKPEKLEQTLGDLAGCVEWIETSRQGTHAIGNLAQRIRQRRVSALIVLDAAVGHKHSDPLVSAAREVRIPTTYAHKGGVAALARAFTQLEKMVGAR